MKRSYSLVIAFFVMLNLGAQTSSITLSGTQYLENFDNLGNGLPTGWGIKTGVTNSTVSGTDATFANTSVLWNVTSGRFNNYASGDIGASGDQSSTDRALGVRQTGSFGDPGAAFVMKLANTVGFTAFQLTFKLQSLDATSLRSVGWVVEYGIGEAPTTFTPLTTTPAILTTGGSTFSNTTVSYNFNATLDNLSTPVLLRIRTSGSSTGSSNRPSTAIDDFVLNYSRTSSTPTINVSVDSLKNFKTNQGNVSASQSFIVSGDKLSENIAMAAPAGYEISTDNITYSNTLSLIQSSGSVVSTTVYARMKGTAQGDFTGNITLKSAPAQDKNIALIGKVNPAASPVTILEAKKLNDGRAVIVSGRLTVKGEYGGRLVYIQDHTGGLAIFSSNLATYPLAMTIGDSIQITGDIATFNGKREIIDPSSVIIIPGQVNKSIVPKIIQPDKLAENEALLVTLENINFTTTGNFSANTNYQGANCDNVFATIRINSSSNPFATKPIPSITQNITGIVEVFNSAFQLMPRLASDISTATKACLLTSSCNPQATLIPQGTSPRNKTFDVVNWNVEWFGSTKAGNGPENDTLQQANVQCVMSKFDADIIALTEVCDTAKLGKALPAGFKYKCSTEYYSHFFDLPETPVDLAQKVCVAYNAATVTPIDTDCRAILTDKAVFTTASANNSFWASGRLPYMFTANVSIDGVSKKIRTVVIHAKSGSALVDYNRRLDDVKSLKTELDTKYPKEAIILLGDFNDDLDTSISTGKASPYADFVKDTEKYQPVTKVLSDAGKRSTGSFSDMIDHIVVSDELRSAIIDNSINVASGMSLNFIGAFNATTTDHYPVWASFNLDKITPVRELTNGLGIKKIYPNPTNGLVTLEYILDTEGMIEIKNVLGINVFSKKIENKEGLQYDTIDLNNTSSGLYYITISSEKGFSTKIISKL